MKKEFSQGSVVVVFSKGTVITPLIDLNYFEEQFDTTIEVGQGVSDKGTVVVIKAIKLQLEIFIFIDRIEVKSFSDKSIEEVAALLAKALEVTNSILPELKWSKIGYNYQYNMTTEEPAIASIPRGFINVTAISEIIGHNVIGVASELWAEVEESIMWLRLKPRNSDKTSNKIIVSANFTEELGDIVLDKETIQSKYTKMKAELDKILKDIGL